MSDISLSAAVRQSLLALQSTSTLIERTQNRLSTGLKVSSALDDPVAFFQAKTLSDRGFDFNEKKDAIDQGVSSVTAAVDGLESVEELVRQLKGIAQSLKSATGAQFTNLITDFSNIRSQIDLLTADTTYQGTNLINGTGETLTIEFSDITTSKVSIASVDSTANGLDVANVVTATTSSTVLAISYGDFAASTVTGGANISGTYVGETTTITTAAANTFTYGTVTVTITASAGGSVTLTQGTTYTFEAVGNNLTAAGSIVAGTGTTIQVGFGAASGADSTAISASDGAYYAIEGNSSSIDKAIATVDAALITLRTQASKLGTNVSLLQTRLEFTSQYVTTLESGASKLTLADLNEEGASLLALQTRQQLGIQALSLAGQAEQGILTLFR
jgi:flagellin-like hook-associated protein FlgL